MKHISIILASLFVFFVLIGGYLHFMNFILVVLSGGLCLLCWLLFYLSFLREERDLLKEGNQYIIDAFQDIRRPISLIKTPLSVVCECECLETVKKEVAIAIHNIEGLEQHLTTLMSLKHSLIYSRNLDVVEHEIGAFIKKKVNSLKTYAAGLNMNLEIVREFDYASAWFDQGKISPLIDKFVASAIDCAGPNKNVIMQILLNDEYWAIKIKDNGLFQKYCKWYLSWLPIHKTVRRRQWKMGSRYFKKMLGLCDGKILVSKEDVLLKFPVRYPFGQLISHYEKEKMHAFQEDQTVAYLGTSSKTKNMDRPVIVLADSDEKFRHYLEISLSENYIVRAYSNGVEALKSIREEYPDLVLCDIELHGMGGAELSSKLKTSRETSSIPVILFGSHLDMNRRSKRWTSLADTFMYKPFDLAELKLEISVLITNSRFLRKTFLQKVFGESFLEQKMESSQQHMNLKFLDEVKAYIIDNLDKEDLIVDDIASKMCMSRTTFYNKWKALTGEAPKYLILRIRMEKARELLESGKFSVSMVAEMVGMKNLKNFRGRYKEYFGRSPKEFLKKM